jgi:O-methyltransferase
MTFPLKIKSRQAIKTFVRKFGYDIVAFPKFEGPYERFQSQGIYAPWIEDPDFMQIFPKIQTHSMVDRYRCYELWDLVSQSAKLKGALIEIGVWRGGTGALIGKKAQLCGISDPVYLCDTFDGVVKASEKDDLYVGGEHSDTSEEIVEKLMKKLGLSNTCILKGIFPDETGSKILNQRFRFCHIDVDVYNSARDIVDWIWPRLVIGGILVFDDYGFPTTTGIRDYVNGRKNDKDRICLFNLNGHSIWIKIA